MWHQAEIWKCHLLLQTGFLLTPPLIDHFKPLKCDYSITSYIEFEPADACKPTILVQILFVPSSSFIHYFFLCVFLCVCVCVWVRGTDKLNQWLAIKEGCGMLLQSGQSHTHTTAIYSMENNYTTKYSYMNVHYRTLHQSGRILHTVHTCLAMGHTCLRGSR